LDPQANIERQRELAEQILELIEANADPSTKLPETVEDLAAELVGLVQALDEWRRGGGFDPYATATHERAEQLTDEQLDNELIAGITAQLDHLNNQYSALDDSDEALALERVQDTWDRFVAERTGE
jgi:hypothetical protein